MSTTGFFGRYSYLIRLKSWKGDYLHRPDQAEGVTTWGTGIGNEWAVEPTAGDTVRLKSWKGDYLHRTDQAQGVTSSGAGAGDEWTAEIIEGDKIRLRSSKGDYLHRPDQQQGVTTWGTGIGNEWVVEPVRGVSIGIVGISLERDQYVELTVVNGSYDLSDHKLHALGVDKVFTFPKGTVIVPGTNLRVYSHTRSESEAVRYSFNSEEPIWKSKDDAVDLSSPRARLFTYPPSRG